jgi:hypothetical protein
MTDVNHDVMFTTQAIDIHHPCKHDIESGRLTNMLIDIHQDFLIDIHQDFLIQF